VNRWCRRRGWTTTASPRRSCLRRRCRESHPRPGRRTVPGWSRVQGRLSRPRRFQGGWGTRRRTARLNRSRTSRRDTPRGPRPRTPRRCRTRRGPSANRPAPRPGCRRRCWGWRRTRSGLLPGRTTGARRRRNQRSHGNQDQPGQGGTAPRDSGDLHRGGPASTGRPSCRTPCTAAPARVGHRPLAPGSVARTGRNCRWSLGHNRNHPGTGAIHTHPATTTTAQATTQGGAGERTWREDPPEGGGESNGRSPRCPVPSGACPTGAMHRARTAPHPSESHHTDAGSGPRSPGEAALPRPRGAGYCHGPGSWCRLAVETPWNPM
jgi:hypothetical protein